MIITDIIDISKKQCKILIDYEFAFVLYKGELHLYHISVGEPISQETYTEIVDKVLSKRCKLRAMNLLKERTYSEKKLREKLVRGQYPESCIEEAIRYVKSFGYINDLQYANDYLFYHGQSLNKQQIFIKLKQRGISEELIREAYQAYCDEGNATSEEELIYKFLRKKHFQGIDNCTLEEKQKLMGTLLRKGFSYDAVYHSMRSFVVDEV